MPVDHSRHLARADQDIAEARERVSRQHAHIAELVKDGHHTRNAEQLLAALEQSVKAFEGHRQLILRTMSE
jgi:hypothetical protein